MGGALVTVTVGVAALFAAQIAGRPEQLDAVRTGDDIRARVTPFYFEGESRTLALHPGVAVPPRAMELMSAPGAAANDEFRTALTEGGAVQVISLSLKVVLEGRRNQQIRVQGITPHILERKPRLDGTLLFMPSQGGDTSLQTMINIEDREPVLRETKFESPLEPLPGAAYFDTHSISLKDTEQFPLVLQVRASKEYFKFELDVEYWIGDEVRHLYVDNNGKPFEIAGISTVADSTLFSYDSAYLLCGDFSLSKAAKPRALDVAEESQC